MSVTDVQYLAGATFSAQVDDRARATYTQKFLVVTNDHRGAAYIINAAQIFAGDLQVPGLWDTYAYPKNATPTEVDEWSFCRAITAQKEADISGGGEKWIVTTTHRPLDDGEKEEDKAVLPWDRPAQISWDREVFREEVEFSDTKPEFSKSKLTRSGRDKTGAVSDIEGPWEIVNTAGGLYEDPLEVPKTRGVLVISKNVQSLAEVISFSTLCDNAINKTNWNVGGFVCLARHAICREVRASDIKTEGDNQFYTVVFRIAIAELNHPFVVPKVERGRTWKAQEVIDGETVPLLDKEPPFHQIYLSDENGEYQYLDENGYRLSKERVEEGDFVVTEWPIYKEISFAGIPTT